MKNAKELMLEYTAFSFREPKKAAEMFAEMAPLSCPILRRSDFLQSTGVETRSPAFPIRARYLSRLPIREYQGADRYSRPGLCRIRGHCGVKQNGTNRSSTLLFEAGCRERKDRYWCSFKLHHYRKIKLFREALNTFEVARANVRDSAGLF